MRYIKTYEIAKLKTSNKQVNDLYDMLQELNLALSQDLPTYLANYCHVGAIDVDKNLVILFLSDQQVYYTLHNMANEILHNFTKYGFYFDGILIKVGKYQKPLFPKYKKLDDKIKNKLQELAQSIGKPELVINQEQMCHDDDQISL